MAESEKQEKTEKDLERMTVKELRAIAAEETDLVGIHSMKKAELVTAITEAKGITQEKAPQEKAPEEHHGEQARPELQKKRKKRKRVRARSSRPRSQSSRLKKRSSERQVTGEWLRC